MNEATDDLRLTETDRDADAVEGREREREWGDKCVNVQQFIGKILG